MDQQQNQLLKKYLDLFLRWKAFVFACVLLSLPIGLGVYLKTPKVYQATSLLSYQQQKISPNKMSPDMEAAIRDVVSTLTQIVTSRTNLENIITIYNLYPEARQRLPMEDVVNILAKDIEIEPSKEGDIFQIRFSGSQPDQVVKVTNALAAKFIEENLKYRAERASETSTYTSNELEMAKTFMDQKEATMRDYKLKHYNELPEQRQANVERLTSLQAQYQSKQDSIQEMERTIVLIQDQIANRRKIISTEAMAATGSQGNRSPAEMEAASPLSAADKLVQLRALLQNLRVKYTEIHPDVKQVKKLIAKLESDIAQGKGGDGRDGLQKPLTGGRSTASDPMILQMETQVKSIRMNIQNTLAEKEELKKSIAQYEQWVSAAPVREAEWSALTREYGQLKRHYDFLVSSDLEAKSMLNLEKLQKGSQFKIVDPARMPGKPVKPDFIKILGIALLGGFGFGLAVPFTRAFLDSSFRDVNDLENYLGLQVACSVPLIETVKEKTWRKRKFLVGVVLGIIAVLIVVAIFIYFWRRGLIVL